MAFGNHLMLDLYDCDPDAMADFELCYNYLNSLPDVIGTHKQSEPFLVKTDGERFPDKAGFSGWVPLVESGVSLHTLDPMRFISIDVYTCKELTTERIEQIKQYTKKLFRPKSWEEKFVLRGENYHLAPEVVELRKRADARRREGTP